MKWSSVELSSNYKCVEYNVVDVSIQKVGPKLARGLKEYFVIFFLLFGGSALPIFDSVVTVIFSLCVQSRNFHR